MNDRQVSILGIPELPLEAFRPVGGRMRLYKKGGGDAPNPDPNIGKAALEEQQTGRDWLAFAKDQFDQGNIRQADLDALTQRVIEQQMATQDESNAMAREDRARYQQTFQPLQDQYIEQAKSDLGRYNELVKPMQDQYLKDAATYDSQDRQDQAAAAAVADQQQASRNANAANLRSMAAMGINPNSGRFMGINSAQQTLGSLAEAGAANNARQQVRDKGLALRADAINMGTGLKATMPDAINMGNGLPSSVAGMYGLGLNAGNSATGNAGAANANFRANQQTMTQGFGGAMQGLQGGAGILNQQYGNQINAWSAQQQANSASSSGLMGGIGAIAGAGIMAF